MLAGQICNFPEEGVGVRNPSHTTRPPDPRMFTRRLDFLSPVTGIFTGNMTVEVIYMKMYQGGCVVVVVVVVVIVGVV